MLKSKSNQNHSGQIETFSFIANSKNIKFKSNQILACQIQMSKNSKCLNILRHFEQITFDYDDCSTIVVKSEQEILLIGGFDDVKTMLLKNLLKFEVKLEFFTSNSNIVKCWEKLLKSNQIKF